VSEMANEHPAILVVDDEAQITRVLRTTLSAQGYDIRVANDGEMAAGVDEELDAARVDHGPGYAEFGWRGAVPAGAANVTGADYCVVGARTKIARKWKRWMPAPMTM